MNKTALITGAAAGIGRACAIRLARDSVAIGVLDLNLEGCEEVVAEIQAKGGKAIALQANVVDRDQVAAAVAKLRDTFGPVNILVNNAGVSVFKPFLDVTDEIWDRTIEINLKGPYICTQTVLPDMLAGRWGRIVNITSSSTQAGAPNMSPYVASKGGLAGLTKALALEFASSGVTVNSIPPGFIDTPMLRASPLDIEASSARSPMGRPGTPEDIAGACAYLCSEEAGYLTGVTLSVNGGRYLQ